MHILHNESYHNRRTFTDSARLDFWLKMAEEINKNDLEGDQDSSYKGDNKV